MKTATIEILEQGETIFGTLTKGKYFVREYEDSKETGGSFFITMEEAISHVRKYQSIFLGGENET